jgi:hypothetical protein
MRKLTPWQTKAFSLILAPMLLLGTSAASAITPDSVELEDMVAAEVLAAEIDTTEIDYAELGNEEQVLDEIDDAAASEPLEFVSAMDEVNDEDSLPPLIVSIDALATSPGISIIGSAVVGETLSVDLSELALSITDLPSFHWFIPPPQAFGLDKTYTIQPSDYGKIIVVEVAVPGHLSIYKSAPVGPVTCPASQDFVGGICVAQTPVCTGNQVLEQGKCINTASGLVVTHDYSGKLMERAFYVYTGNSDWYAKADVDFGKYLNAKIHTYDHKDPKTLLDSGWKAENAEIYKGMDLPEDDDDHYSHKATQSKLSYIIQDRIDGEAKSGSTHLTLFDSFLRTLPNGVYIVTLYFVDGTLDVELIVDMPQEVAASSVAVVPEPAVSVKRVRHTATG